MNFVMLIGNVGRDPETRTTQSGSTVANFSLATSERWTKDGEKQEKTTWHTCVVWGALSAVVQKFVVKGSKLAVQGRYEARKWTDKEGNERTAYEVNVASLELLGEKRAAKENHEDEEEEEDPRPRRRSVSKPSAKPKEKYKSDMDLDDEIPW
jgi:single-strand DNA-binding protein